MFSAFLNPLPLQWKLCNIYTFLFNKGKSLLISKLPTQLFSCGNSFSNMNVCLPLELFYLGTDAHKLRIRLECNAIIPWTVHNMKHYKYSLSQTHSFPAIFWKVSCIWSGVSRNRDPCPIHPHPQDLRVLYILYYIILYYIIYSKSIYIRASLPVRLSWEWKQNVCRERHVVGSVHRTYCMSLMSSDSMSFVSINH